MTTERIKNFDLFWAIMTATSLILLQSHMQIWHDHGEGDLGFSFSKITIFFLIVSCAVHSLGHAEKELGHINARLTLMTGDFLNILSLLCLILTLAFGKFNSFLDFLHKFWN